MLDQDLAPVISATKKLPEFMDGVNYKNWGIFRMMNQNPEDVALKLDNSEDENDYRLVIGKSVATDNEIHGYVLFVMDNLQFQTSIAALSSNTVITDTYGWVYVTNNYQFQNTMNRFDLNATPPYTYINSSNGKCMSLQHLSLTAGLSYTPFLPLKARLQSSVISFSFCFLFLRF